MDQLTFAYKLNPYVNTNWTRNEMLFMEHYDKPVLHEEEK